MTCLNNLIHYLTKYNITHLFGRRVDEIQQLDARSGELLSGGLGGAGGGDGGQNLYDQLGGSMRKEQR